MIRIKNLTIRNFMSIGNATQAVNFDRGDLTLVLGENLDLGSNGSRNGTGKTTLINALSYGLYGNALSEIKVNNLINKTNDKNMLVSVEFEVNGTNYRIERGRKPNILRFQNLDRPETEDTDDQQGENRDTQKEINALLGLSHTMFKHTLALNTYTTPFLAERTNDQKNIIEELLGITLLTEKAEALKILSKATKDAIKEEEFRIGATIKANEHIEQQINSLKLRQSTWTRKHDENINDLSTAIDELSHIDIDSEIITHKANKEKKQQADEANIAAKQKATEENNAIMQKYLEEKAEYDKWRMAVNQCNMWIERIETENVSLNRRVQVLEKDIAMLADHKCHACGQDLHDEKQEQNKAAKEAELREHALQILTNHSQETEHKLKLAELDSRIAPVEPKTVIYTPVHAHLDKTFYETLNEAHEHRNTLALLSQQLDAAKAERDPYAEQIYDMVTNGLQQIDYNEMNRLVDLLEHQKFLLNLLSNKDSFVRKKIIEQNLNYLNNRLTHYLRDIGLPHLVRFMPDLTVEITDLGRDLDFDNLSRGERNRLILSLSWAFRDVWESLYNHVNLMFVDELVDNGLDTNGVESAIKIMKGMARERNKSVWLVSHREELISRVHNTMKVIKEGGFTTYETGDE